MLEKRESMSTKQIRGALGLNKTATSKLKAELQKLIKAKKITKQSHHYLIVKDSKDKVTRFTYSLLQVDHFFRNIFKTFGHHRICI